ncbi:MAG: antitoxin CptB [Alphaproteobacteria bacterium]|jgi:antitoxin CptB
MPMEMLKKEINFRGSRRGIKELDIIFGTFIDAELNNLNASELEFFRDFLLESDLDLLEYFQGEKKLPQNLNTAIFEKIKVANAN